MKEKILTLGLCLAFMLAERAEGAFVQLAPWMALRQTKRFRAGLQVKGWKEQFPT